MIHMSKEKIKDFAVRAGKTFIQAFLASLSIDMIVGVTDFEALKKVALSVLIAAVAAGISAVWNMTLEKVNSYIEKRGEKDDL